MIWVNSIGHRAPSLTLTDARRALEKARAMLAPRTPQVVAASPRPRAVIAPRVLPWHGLAAVRRLNGFTLARQIEAALGAKHKDVVLVTNSPPSVPVLGRLGETKSLYFCMDDYLNLPGTDPRMLRPLEEALLAKVDAIVVTAKALLDRKRCHTGRGYYLPQGVNYDHFATPRPVPAAMTNLPRPIVGFAGGIGSALDVPTLEQTADAVANGTLLLVGPIQDPTFIPKRPNVVVLGPQPYDTLPAFVQAFDVGIIPYVDNDWIRAVDPLKLLEYLAAGIPVVTSPLPEVAKYADVVTVAPLGPPFAAAVVQSIGNPARDARQAVARANQWQARAERFLEIVQEIAVI